MWIFGFSLGVCSMEPGNLVPSLEYLVSNGRQVLLGGIRLGGSATKREQGLTPTTTMVVMLVVLFVEVMVSIGRISNKMMMMRRSCGRTS